MSREKVCARTAGFWRQISTTRDRFEWPTNGQSVRLLGDKRTEKLDVRDTQAGELLPVEKWQPTTVEEVKRTVEEDLRECDAEQRAAFKGYAVEPYVAPIVRYGKMESAVVVARRENEVIYWEDIEDGFNISPIGPDGQILEPWCNQDALGLALDAWIAGRRRAENFSPAVPNPSQGKTSRKDTA